MVLLLAWLPAAGAVSLGKLTIFPAPGESLRIEIELLLSAAEAGSAPRKPAPAVPAATAANPELDRELQRLKAQLDAGDRVLAGMLERVAVMEVAVQELQRRLNTPAAEPASAPAAAPAAKAEPVKAEATKPELPKTETPKAEAPGPAVLKPEAVKPVAPPPPVMKVEAVQTVSEQPPRRKRSWVDSLLNEALLVLAGGALIMLLGAVWWMWGRRVPKAAQVDPDSVAA